VVSKYRLVVPLIFTLVLVNIQCVALCTLESCTGKETASTPSSADVPPCHQRHDAPAQPDPAPCSHRVIQAVGAMAPVTPDLAAGDIVAHLPVVSPVAHPPLSGVDTLAARAPSPSGLAVLSSVVLRI
jgi:hypothetical protein